MRFNVRRIEGDEVVVLNAIKDFEDTNADTITIDDEQLIKKLTSKKIEYTYNTQTNEIVSKRVKALGFENFKEGSNKEKVVQNMYDYFNQRLDPWANIDLAIYMHSMLALADKGFVITDENREEKYLEVLETGDEGMIELLEDYLIHKDNIQQYVSYKKLYNDVKEKLLDLDDDDPKILELLKSK